MLCIVPKGTNTSRHTNLGDYMLTVLITYLDLTTNLVDCHTLDDICLDNVLSMRVIRDERIIKTSRVA